MFTKALRDECHTIHHILDMYDWASGQVVNFKKSALCVSRLVPMVVGAKLAWIVGVNFVRCHERHLGLPSFTGRNKKQVFVNIKNRTWNRLKVGKFVSSHLGAKRFC
ncbi:hypothetical protein Dsin_024388 [Dipteronia sinensis]|uniref:Uncharacterized protein n=1 Tax=Dipteronia sinensis TaxID=43782 RepID=A0AAD9ZVD6_9ROSI|nr:hypothetical protein Dsin_024388 [Dipteronia sinensis]